MSIGTNTPFGFMPSSITGTGNSTFNTFQYNINPSNTSPIGIGDLVKFDSSGFIVAAANTDANIVGSFGSLTYAGQNQPVLVAQPQYWTGSTTGSAQPQANVYMDPSISFVAQMSGAGIVQSNLVTNPYCSFVSSAPNAATGNSLYTVDSSSFSSSPSGKQLKLVGLAPTPNGQIENAYGIQYNLGLFRLINAFMNS